MFGKINSIDPLDRAGYSKTQYLTIDIDWADDVVLNDSIELIERAGVEATWFVTHETEVLERLRGNSNFEIGIHPNFNFLLNGDDRNGRTAQEVVDRLMEIVPEAKSVRSHSMTQSSRLLQLFKATGLSHDCNHFIPESAGIELRPWMAWNGLVRVPYFWEDDISCEYGPEATETSMESLHRRPGLRVFDFHPIHIFLNTDQLDRYERTRPLHQIPGELIKHRFDGVGVRTLLSALLEFEQAARPREDAKK